jgi:hypothetical protein
MGKFDRKPTRLAQKYLNIGVFDSVHPVIDADVTVEFEGELFKGKTDSNGTAEILVPGKVYAFNLIVDKSGYELNVSFHQAPNIKFHGVEIQLVRKPVIVEPEVPVRELYGRLKLVGAVTLHDKGREFQIGASFFAALWALKNDKDRLVKNLEFLSKNNINYIRALGCVGPISWTDRTIDPSWSDYDELVGNLTDLTGSYGMRVQWTIIGDEGLVNSQSARRDLVNRFVQISKGREDKIAFWEVINEYYLKSLSKSEIRELAKILKRETGILTSLSSYNIVENDDLYKDSDADLLSIHLDRNTSGLGNEWRPVRQAWEVQFIEHSPRAWISNEPIGPQSSIASETDPLRIAMSAALVQLCGGAAYTLHTGAGIRFGGIEDKRIGRAENFWEVPNIQAILDGLNSVKSLLHPDLANWRRHNSNSRFPDYPFDTELLQPYLEDETFLRAFVGSTNTDFIQLPIRVRGNVPFKAKRNMSLEIFDPLTAEKLDSKVLNVGETFILPGSSLAYVIKGKYL